MAIAEELRLEVTAQVETAVRDLQRINKTTGEIIKKGEILKRTGEQLTRFGRSWSLFVTAPILAAGAAMIKTASDAEEITSKYQTVFSSIGEQAERMAREISDSFGISTVKTKEMLGATGDLLVGFGFTEKMALDLSAQVTKLGADVASFSNYAGGAEGAANALTKALLGEREMAKSLGIVINEENVKSKILEMTKEGLTFETERQAKAYATLLIAQEQSQKAIGDVERTSGSLANQMRFLKQDIIDLAVSFGKELIPQAKEIIAKVRNAVKWFTDLDKGTKELIITVASIAAVIGPLILIIGTLTKAIYGITIAMQAFNLTNPVGWIILAASAAATLAYIIVKHWDKIITWTRKIYEAIKKFLVEQFILMMQDVGKIAAGFVNTWNWVKSKFTKEEFVPIENAFQGFTDKLITVRREMDNVGDSAKETAEALADIEGDINNLNNATKDTAKSMGLSEEVLKKLYDAYSQLPEGQIEALEANIKFWEGQLENAGTYGPIIEKVIVSLKEELRRLNEEFDPTGVESVEAFRDSVLSAFSAIDGGILKVSKDTEDFISNLFGKDIPNFPSVGDPFAGTEDTWQARAKSMQAFGDALLRTADRGEEFKQKIEELQEVHREFEEIAKTTYGEIFEALGEAIIKGEGFWESFAEIMKQSVAKTLEALGQEAIVRAIAGIAKGIGGNPKGFAEAAAWGAASAAAFTGAGIVKALGEGGIVTKPTLAMIGEKGPEAVVPLGKGGAAPTIIVNVSGSVLTEEGIARRIGSIWRRQNRGY